MTHISHYRHVDTGLWGPTLGSQELSQAGPNDVLVRPRDLEKALLLAGVIQQGVPAPAVLEGVHVPKHP